ncbi:hypothetical protein Ddye_014588 [Dipteronia dyeriana]|uniref:R13L1/DRL21-like LRR repeat region domain-containing protein n=1 Tax=Dipteronia dyeriana TaxID=168575 RepID=A0AAE0CKQ0_9ROSI|nr:hypothetical protein Ddye_014588 [Dipteronia dyeriana]
MVTIAKYVVLIVLKSWSTLESLSIRGLGNVIDGAEAKNANIRSKKYLLHLELYFDDISEASSTEVCRKDEAVVDALQAPPNLERLVLKGYRGMSFDWMGSLTQLRKLTLEDCINCERLPPLGKLPLLESLEVRRMRGLKGWVGADIVERALKNAGVIWGVEIEKPCSSRSICQYTEVWISFRKKDILAHTTLYTECFDNTRFAARGIYENLMATGYIDLTERQGTWLQKNYELAEAGGRTGQRDDPMDN